MDENGDIYGRGTQDTKDISIQYLEAIRRLRKDNITLARTIYLTFMPGNLIHHFMYNQKIKKCLHLKFWTRSRYNIINKKYELLNQGSS